MQKENLASINIIIYNIITNPKIIQPENARTSCT